MRNLVWPVALMCKLNSEWASCPVPKILPNRVSSPKPEYHHHEQGRPKNDRNAMLWKKNALEAFEKDKHRP